MKKFYEKYWMQPYSNEGYANMPPEWNASDLKRVLDFTKPHGQGRILDLGCGDGTFTYHLSRLSGSKGVIGIDISEAAIRKSRTQYPGMDFRVYDGDTLPFPDGFFDFVAMVEMAEHLVDVAATLQEVHRVLAPGGKVLITTTDFNFLKKVLVSAFFWDKYFYPTNPHIRFFTKKTLASLLKQGGFCAVSYQWHGSYWHLMPKGQMVIAAKSTSIHE